MAGCTYDKKNMPGLYLRRFIDFGTFSRVLRIDSNSFNLTFVKQNMLEPIHNFDPQLKQHYWAASFLLPLGSIFVLSVLILLMVLFKRCPHIIAGIVTGFLTTIIIFIIVVSIKAEPVYT